MHTVIPIAVGERMYTRWDFKVFEDGAVDIIQPDVSHQAESETRKIAAMARLMMCRWPTMSAGAMHWQPASSWISVS